MPYPLFDRSRLILKPLDDRIHDLDYTAVLPVRHQPEPLPDNVISQLNTVAERIRTARQRGASVILIMGAHLLRAGVQLMLIDLLERGLISHIAMNGAGPIHDFELALIGKTTESVSRYIKSGEFGLWKETGRINDIAIEAAREGIGLGEAVGREIANGDFPYRQFSVLARAFELRIPVTVHIGIGYDIIHEHPNADGAALGATSYTDFLVFARAVQNLEQGVLMNFGSAVMGPEVYLKALAMARNVAHQEGLEIRAFTTLVCDLVPLEGDLSTEAPKSEPGYYFRPWKTILVRTVAEGGESVYVRGNHRVVFPNLYRLLSKDL